MNLVLSFFTLRFLFNLTGLCAENASIAPLNHDLFHYLSYDDMCEFRGMITYHEINTRSAMIKAYKSLFDPKLTCSSPHEYQQ